MACNGSVIYNDIRLIDFLKTKKYRKKHTHTTVYVPTHTNASALIQFTVRVEHVLSHTGFSTNKQMIECTHNTIDVCLVVPEISNGEYIILFGRDVFVCTFKRGHETRSIKYAFAGNQTVVIICVHITFRSN